MRVKWNEWGKIRDLLGLRTMQVIHGPGAETFIRVDGPEEILRSLGMNEKRKPKNNNMLAVILAQMVNAAEAQPGHPERTDLKGGMRVDVMKGIDGVLRMQISREKVEPSEKEWQTTLKHLPEGLAESNVKRLEHQGRHFIRCDLG